VNVVLEKVLTETAWQECWDTSETLVHRVTQEWKCGGAQWKSGFLWLIIRNLQPESSPLTLNCKEVIAISTFAFFWNWFLKLCLYWWSNPCEWKHSLVNKD